MTEWLSSQNWAWSVSLLSSFLTFIPSPQIPASFLPTCTSMHFTSVEIALMLPWLSVNMAFFFYLGQREPEGKRSPYLSPWKRPKAKHGYPRYACTAEGAQKVAFSALFSEAWVNIAARVFLWSRPWKQRLFPSRVLMSLNMSDWQLSFTLIQHHLLNNEGKVLATKLYGYTNTKYFLQNENNMPK